MNTIYTRYIKYSLDKVFAVLILILFWWLYLLCAVAIIVCDGWPIIYRQVRIGERGRRFMIYKFRSMIQNADKVGPLHTEVGDARVTPLGNFLRKTSLDEIPQVFNVLLGDMSFVGYRPDVPKPGDDYSQSKYLLRPGITGLAQVNGRSNMTVEQQLYYESEYPKRVSFFMDIWILCRTALVVLHCEDSV